MVDASFICDCEDGALETHLWGCRRTEEVSPTQYSQHKSETAAEERDLQSTKRLISRPDVNTCVSACKAGPKHRFHLSSYRLQAYC